MIHSFTLKKRAISFETFCIFHHVFNSFSLIFPFLYPRANHSRLSLLHKRVTVSVWLPSLCKRATLSDSHPSLFTKERHERITLFQERITISLFPSQKASDLFEKPKSEFPTLLPASQHKTLHAPTPLVTLLGSFLTFKSPPCHSPPYLPPFPYSLPPSFPPPLPPSVLKSLILLLYLLIVISFFFLLLFFFLLSLLFVLLFHSPSF